MLRVIKGGKKSEINYGNIYVRLFDESLNKYAKNNENRNLLKKIVYYGVKIVNEIEGDNLDYNQKLKLFDFIEAIKTSISLLTPNELITVFPVDKQYDGDKYQVKDYFFTMNELQKIGMDNIIMGNVESLLWDYENKEVRKFLVNSLSVLSYLERVEKGESFLEKWARENNIDTYMLYEDKTTDEKYLYDEKGNKVSIKKEIPKYLKVISGGLKCDR